MPASRAGPVRAARRLGKRGLREADRHFLVEGPQVVREAIAEDALTELFATVDAEARHADLLDAAVARGVPVHRVGGDVLGTLAQTVHPQGLVGVAPFRDVPLDDVLAARPRLVVVLAHVRDPGNAGTVLRTADAADADAVVFTVESVDPYNGKCVRASAGSLFHLPFVAAAPLADAVGGLRDVGVRVVAADRRGSRDLDTAVDAGDLRGPTAWLFGNEAWGLRTPERELVDLVVRIPIHGRAESLNLAAAAAVCLYASARAQRAAGGCRSAEAAGQGAPVSVPPVSVPPMSVPE
jgi:TrmH family RNA methyltransferase